MRRSLIVLLALAASLVHADQRSSWTKPDIHGDSVIFTCEGDLWLGSMKDHAARRVTSHPGVEYNAHFSPDGKMVAFTGSYDDSRDVYVMPLEGGAPQRLTYDTGYAEVQGWAPDGKFVIFRSRRNNPPGGINRLYEVPVGGGQAKMLPVPQGEFADLNEQGLMIYVPVTVEWMNWFHYQGGGADDIWLADLPHKKFTRLTDNPSVDTTPVWAGGDVYFVSQRAGTSNLFKLDPDSKAVKQLTQLALPVRYPGSDGEQIVFQTGPNLGVYNTKTGKAETLAFDLNSDRIHAREQRVPLAPEVGAVAIGPGGKRVAVEARGQVWSIAAENGDARVLENKPGARAMNPVWSPDGKKVAYLTDRSGEYQVWVDNALGSSEPTQLTKDLKGEYRDLVWSPDGKWLATAERSTQLVVINAEKGAVQQVDISPNYSSYDSFRPEYSFSADSKLLAYTRLEPNWNATVWIHDMTAGKNVQVSSAVINSASPAFGQDGKYIAFISERQLSPAYSNAAHKYGFDNTMRVTLATLSPDVTSPFLPKNDEEGAEAKKEDAPKPTPDLEGISGRTIDVPIGASRYSKVLIAGNRLLLLDKPDASGPNRLIAYDLDKQKSTNLSDGVGDCDLSNDGKKLLILRGSQPSIVDASTGPFGASDGAIALGAYSLTVDPQQEWKQIFYESWRIARDFFYDPNMHGVDWNAVRKQYEARLPLVGDRSDLTRLIADMISELNIGHAYVFNPGGDIKRTPMGYLGADFEAVPGADAVKIKRILRGNDFTMAVRSPLLEPGVNVKPGDYIVSIAGQPVQRDQDIQSLLIATPGQVIAIGVNTQPKLEGARIVRVKPLSSEAGLRYADWVEGRREYVHTHGGANIGYVHIPNMGSGGFQEFAQGHYPNLDSDGMIYDTRYNTGGSISSLLLQDIAAKRVLFWQPRYGTPWAREDWAPLGPRAAICNEYNFSDGELFIESWKRMKVGPVVGKRTAGAEVGSGGGYRLIDGGSIYIPNYGAYSPEGKWVIEGVGTSPDIVVEQDPNLVLEGRDPQLDKTIEVLNAIIRKFPPKLPAHPAFPDKVYKK
ncbi:MAG: tricorn protease [Fimbriimonadaceae bacterium]|jgi:tricorn protease|nr:tricorn protease [Fimbriimonadaceae bacterium]